jgi:hypothetical protein
MCNLKAIAGSGMLVQQSSQLYAMVLGELMLINKTTEQTLTFPQSGLFNYKPSS